MRIALLGELEVRDAQVAMGRPAESLIAFQRSASIQRRLGDRSREARALDGTGEAYRELGAPLRRSTSIVRQRPSTASSAIHGN
ncbi:hypothetical protein [Nonomuraea sp. NPDC049158]|uniref:hypothetical protein n=1 Tax=Nonomuraea sp. NPDC049158 TaxID=3155649 RepID=UPI003407D3B2